MIKIINPFFILVLLWITCIILIWIVYIVLVSILNIEWSWQNHHSFNGAQMKEKLFDSAIVSNPHEVVGKANSETLHLPEDATLGKRQEIFQIAPREGRIHKDKPHRAVASACRNHATDGIL